MNAIVKWTVKQRRLSTIWWSIAVIGFVFINMIFYPSFKDQAAELQKSFENLPEAAVQLFGGSTDFFSPVGFLNSQIFFFMLPLLLGILAISLGAGLIAKEEQEKTIESLLARPISRTKLLLSKALAGAIIVSLVAVVGLITVVACKELVRVEIGTKPIVEAVFLCWLLALSFGAVALLLTSIGRARGASIGLTTAIALGGYIVSSLASTVSWLETPSKVFPFHYYQSEAVLRGTYEWKNALFFLVIIIVCAGLSSFFFRTRDLE
jgi:ABC-2 type transport system permease protein